MDAMRLKTFHPLVVAANSTGDVYCAPPGIGKWRLKEIGLLPSAAVVASGTDYATFTVTNAAGTSMGSYTTESTGLTAGTYRGFSLTATVNPEVDGDSVGERVKVAVTEAGTGPAVNAQVVCLWESVQAA